MNMTRVLSLAATLCFFVTSTQAGSVITVATDQTNANTQLDVNHSLEYDFTVATTGDYQIVGDFTIKRGHATSADLAFGVYSGSNHTGSLIGSDVLHSTAFSQSYTATTFDVAPTSIHLIAGHDYSVWLHTNAATTGSKQYFIKGDSFLVSGNTGAVPEPSSLISIGLAGLIGCGYLIRRRKAV